MLCPSQVSLAAVDHDPPPSEAGAGDRDGPDGDRGPPTAVNIDVDQSLDEFTVSVSGEDRVEEGERGEEREREGRGRVHSLRVW